MFKSKKDVDIHVQDVFSKVKSENERHLRGLAIAKQYFNVGDAKTAQKYVCNYLSIKEQNASAHKLLGQIYDSLGHYNKALGSYKRSLELDDAQKDVVRKVCELYTKVPLDRARAQVWIDRGQAMFPGDPVIFRLKAYILENGDKVNGNLDELQKLIQAELLARPRDPDLRCKFLQVYLDMDKAKEAYMFAMDTEKSQLFPNCLSWYQKLLEVQRQYGRQGAAKDPTFFSFYLRILDKVLELTWNDSDQKHDKLMLTVTLHLKTMDEVLLQARQIDTNKKGWLETLRHYHAQLYFNMATLLLKKLELEVAKPMCLSLFLAAFNTKPPDRHVAEFKDLHFRACFRVSLSGHMLINLSGGDQMRAVHSAQQKFCCIAGQEAIVEKVFGKSEKSAFLKDTQFHYLTVEYPSSEELREYDEAWAVLYSSSLHHIVWLCLQQYDNNDDCQPNYGLQLFTNLPEEAPNLHSAASTSLSRADVEAFLYATVKCASQRLSSGKGIDKLLPVNLCEPLCTPEQAEWWTCASMLSTGAVKDKVVEVKQRITAGLEAVRLIGIHGMPAELIVHLAKTFQGNEGDLVLEDVENEQMLPVNPRTSMYWEAAVSVLKRLQQNQHPPQPKQPMFRRYGKTPSRDTLKKLLEDAQYALGIQAEWSKNDDTALKIYEQLNSPIAAYRMAQIYKRMADKSQGERDFMNKNEDNDRSTMLKLARDSLYLTSDRLRSPQVHRKHPINLVLGDKIQEVETELSQLELCGESSSSSEGDAEESRFSSLPRHKTNSTSTPLKALRVKRQEARPSPERLDAQLRSIELSQSNTMMKILSDQNKTLVQQNRMLHDNYSNIADVMKDNKDALLQLKTELGLHRDVMIDVQNVMKDVHDLMKYVQKDLKSRDKDARKSSDQTEVESEEYEGQYTGEDNSASNTENGSELPSSYQLAGFPAWTSNPRAPLMPSFAAGGLPTAGCYYPQQPPRNSHPLTYYPSMGLQLADPVNHSLGVAGASPFGISPIVSVGIRPMDMPPGKIKGPSSLGHELPANVTITTRETLPVAATTTTAPLSVSVPFHKPQSPVSTPQSVHSYQINLPPTSLASPVRVQSETENAPAVPLTTSSLLSSVPPPTYSAVTPSPPKTTSAERIRRISSSTGRRTSLDGTKDRKDSACSEYEEEHDPMPDFVPIIPLPEEVEVNTGEEEEEVLFCERAKLYRFVEKEWKERGLGDIKILYHPESKKARVVMRREQVLKICANHFILSNMFLEAMHNSDKAWLWAAHDYADGKCVRENFCVRFKLPESAAKFKEAFEKGKALTVVTESEAPKNQQEQPAAVNQSPAPNQPGKLNLGGFTFNTQPKVNEPEPKPEHKVINTKEQQKPSPFATFSFQQTPSFGIGTGIAGTLGGSVPTGDGASTQASKVKEGSKLEEKASNKAESLSQLFKPKEGSWSCEGCYTRNDADKDKCVCCETANPNIKPGSWVCSQCPVRNDETTVKCVSCDAAKPAAPTDSSSSIVSKTPTFGNFAASSLTPATSSKPPSFGNLAVGSGGTGFSFASVTSKPAGGSILGSNWTPTTTTTASTGFSFGSFGQTTQGSGFSLSGATSTTGEFKFSSPSFNTTASSLVAPLAKATPGSTASSSSVGGGTIFGGANTLGKSANQIFGSSLSSFPTSFSQTLFKTPNAGSATISNTATGSGVPVASEPQVSTTFTVNLPKGITITPVGTKTGMEDAKKSDELPSSFGVLPSLPSFGSLPSAQSRFTFKQDPPGILSKEAGVEDAKKSDELPSLLFGGQTFLPNFGSLASTQSHFTFKQDPTETPPKEGTPFKFGTPQSQTFEFSFKPKSPKSPTKTPKSPEDIKAGTHDESNEYYEDDGEGDRIYFQPVIPLPDEVEVKTGEEDEEILYSHRAKLYRFKDSEWKERGLGDIKILQHNTTKKIRLLMRRERVHKICLNHYLTPDIEFMPKDERAFFWLALDFAEGVQEDELFSIKFKTPEIAKEFIAAVNKVQRLPVSESEGTKPEVKPSESSSFGASFEYKSSGTSIFGGTQFSPASKATSFTFGSEDKKSEESVSEDKKDGEVEIVYEKNVTEEQRRRAEALQLPSNFYSYETAPPCPGCRGCRDDLKGANELNKSVEEKTPKTPEKEKATNEASKPAVSSSLTSSLASFGEKSVSQFSFSSLANDSSSFSLSSKEGGPDPWVHAGAKVFGREAAAEEEEDDVEANTHDPHFEPVIPLPDLIEVKTGEENCEKLFAERSKLYRYDAKAGEWKERGIGEMKILRELSGKIRILLRRDQVHKVVCNHWLTADLSFQPLMGSEKVLHWVAKNYPDEQEGGSVDTLSVKFKNEGICNKFKETIAKLQEEMQNEIPQVIQELHDSDIIGNGPAERHDDDDDGDDDDDDDDDDEVEVDNEECDPDGYYEEEDLIETFKEFAEVSVKTKGSWEELGDCEVKAIVSQADGVGFIDVCRGDEEKYTIPISCVKNLTVAQNISTWMYADSGSGGGSQFTAKFYDEAAAENFKDVCKGFEED